MSRQRIDSASVQEIVVVEYLYGDGTEESPVRSITQFRAKSGELLAVQDPIHDRRELYVGAQQRCFADLTK